MQVILSHSNLDFDGLASMIAAQKLHPQSEIVLPAKIGSEVDHFLAIYKDAFPYKQIHQVNFEQVKTVILVDTNDLDRTGETHLQAGQLEIIIYDHHPVTDRTTLHKKSIIENVGATVTLLAELLIQEDITISPFEATVFSLGLYADTGSFTYGHTTARDFKAAAYFFENGANLRVLEQFSDPPLKEDQQKLFQELLEVSEFISMDGLEIIIASATQEDYTGHLSQITRKLLDVTGVDAVFSIVQMGNKTFITFRGGSERLEALPLIQSFGGGGHKYAAAAMVKNEPVADIADKVRENCPTIIKPSLTAQDMMSAPVRVVAPETTIETTSKMLYRYGHTGFPVVENKTVIGIVSRRDVDKALHHQLGHAPVKGFMSHQPITITPGETIERIREVMIEEHVGRLPVMKNNTLVGIVSRSDMIQAMHGEKTNNKVFHSKAPIPRKRQVTETMRKKFPPPIFELLELIGDNAAKLSMHAYLIGGMVRDLLLEKENKDIDIVVEGDGIKLALHLQANYGGQVRKHEEFRTATWRHPTGFQIDLTSARTEYYDFPAALPSVEMSTIKEDLYRRDFTINSMAISLHRDHFGELLDYFHGFEDLKKGTLRILYNLSFVEDPTRILRALRFECRLDFRMDSQTERFAYQSANNLLSVSKLRLASELSRLFTEDNVLHGVNRIYELKLQTSLISRPASHKTASSRIALLHRWHRLLTDNGIVITDSIWICYMYVLTIGEVRDAYALESYCLSKKDVSIIMKLIDLFEEISTSDLINMPVAKLHSHFSTYPLESLLGFFVSMPIRIEEKNNVIDYLLKREKLNSKITGDDLKQQGLPPSPLYKDILHDAEILQLESPVITKREILENLLMKYET